MCQPDAVERSRSVALWLAAGLAALVVAGAVFVVVVVLPAGDSDDSDDAAAAGHDACAAGPGPDQLVLYFDGQSADEDMRAAEKALRGDDRISGAEMETRHEAWERFKTMFAAQPELVKLAREEALPSTVWLLAADGVTLADLDEKLVDEYPKVGDTSVVKCPVPTTAPPTSAAAPS
jgi:hypothetical protein